MQNKSASGNSNTPQSAESRNAIFTVITTDQQAGSASIVDTNPLPSTNSINVSNSKCHDSTSVLGQTVKSSICTNVNVTSKVQSRSVDLCEMTLPSFTDNSKQVPLHFICDLDLYFKLRHTTLSSCH